MKTLIIPIIHGVQFKYNFDYGYKAEMNNFVDKIRNNLNPELKKRCIFKFINWNEDVSDRQIHAYKTMEADLRRKTFRKFKHTIGSDIFWWGGIELQDGFRNQFFKKVNNEINKYKELYDPGAYVIGIAHSQGSQMFYEYCFKYKCDGFISMGSPIGAYSGKYNNWGSLPQHLQFWVNIYNKWDFISTNFDNHPNKEIRNFVINYDVSNWNPLNWTLFRSHTMYWKSSKVHKLIAETLNRV